MKKITFSILAMACVVSSANAGWLESLGFGKKAEPATLEEACDTAEIKKVCPEVVLGTETITDCLAENVKSLSKQCASYIKKSVASKKDAAVAQLKNAKEDFNANATESKAKSDAKAESIKSAAAAKVDAVKQDVAAKKAAAAEKRNADKAAAAEKKAAAVVAGKEITNAVRETGASAKETGRAIKDML